MARFNQATESRKVENLAGGQAFSQDEKLAFLSLLLTSFMNNQFYRSGDKTLVELKDLMNKIGDKKFIAKCAIYARKEFGMRSISHVVAGEVAKNVKGLSWTKNFFHQVVKRPDDVTEILAYYMTNYGKPIPNSLKKGLSLALEDFNSYQLGKYKGEGKEVSLVDAVNLVHPASNEHLRKLMHNDLETADTWEAKLSATKGNEKGKEKVWSDLLKENSLGYMALLRNLRNILEQSPKSVPLALETLVDRNRIKKSLVLPFRFLTAIKQLEETNLEGATDCIIAINKALDSSLDNVPKFKGKTLVALDVSGSMNGRPSEIGSLFSAVLVKANKADFLTFDDDATYKTLNPLDSTLTLAKSIPFTGGGTNFHSIFEEANKAYDRIIILSDMQSWVGYYTPIPSYNEYVKRTGANPKIYSFDLQGYGSMQFPQDNVFCLAGFSDKVFDIMALLEGDRQALLNKVDSISL